MASRPELMWCTSCRHCLKTFHGTIVLQESSNRPTHSRRNKRLWKKLFKGAARNEISRCRRYFYQKSVTGCTWGVWCCKIQVKLTLMFLWQQRQTLKAPQQHNVIKSEKGTCSQTGFYGSNKHHIFLEQAPLFFLLFLNRSTQRRKGPRRLFTRQQRFALLVLFFRGHILRRLKPTFAFSLPQCISTNLVMKCTNAEKSQSSDQCPFK